MREILFRGKRIDNSEWIYGDLIQLFGGQKYIIDNKFGACIDDKGNFINTEPPFVCEVISETVGQYTNIKDKNGTKIFEGDIVRATIERGEGCQPIRTEKGVIGYNGIGMVGLILYKDKNGENVWSDFFNELSLSGAIDDYYFEVIGNIYDKF